MDKIPNWWQNVEMIVHSGSRRNLISGRLSGS